jgi:hypothetical protein
MELLGANSLEVLRKIEQRKNSKEKCYGLPMAAVVAIAVKLVSQLACLMSLGVDRKSAADALDWVPAF